MRVQCRRNSCVVSEFLHCVCYCLLRIQRYQKCASVAKKNYDVEENIDVARNLVTVGVGTKNYYL
jgi:hypothetical protein